MIQAIFFDLDGTLVDTESLAVDVTRDWLQQRGHQLSADQENFIVGRTWALASELLTEAFPLAMSPQQAEREMIDAFRQRTAQGVMPVKGAAEAIGRLHGHFRLFVVSGSPRRDIAHALESLSVQDKFEAILGAEDYARSKPAPDPYLTALSLAKLTDQQALVFEDSEAGVTSAQAANLPVVLVTGAERTPQHLPPVRWKIKDWLDIDPTWIFQKLG